MSKKDKLIERFKSRPSDFTYEELVLMLSYFGFKENKKAGGSRRKFIQAKTNEVISLHKPHPGNIIKKYIMEYVYNTLLDWGYLTFS